MPIKPSISTTGANITYYSSAALSGINVKQTIINQTIPSMSLLSYRPFSFDLTFDVSTPTLGVLPSLTIAVEYAGKTSFTLITGNIAALSLTNRRFKIKGSITCNSDDGTTVWLEGETRQNSGATIGSAGNTSFFNEYTAIDNTLDQPFLVTIQASSLLGGVNVILKKGLIGMF